MDTLTHALSGALLARATARDGDHLSVRRRVGVGFLAAAFPDSDFVIRLFNDPLTYFNLHRGVTHSLLMLPLWALLLAFLFALIWREHEHWRDYFAVTLMSIAMHIGGDVITAYGTKLLAPLSDWKASYPTTFIIDLWFTGIIAAALIASLIWRRSRIPAVSGLVVLAAYIGFQSLQLQQATHIGREYVAALGLKHATVRALPQPLSPFNWKIIVSDGDAYHIANVNLRRTQSPPTPAADAGFFTRLDAAYQPLGAMHWREVEKYSANPQWRPLAKTLWQTPQLASYRAFAEFPALDSVEQRKEGECVWYQDLRFVIRDFRSPFKFGLCRGKNHDWRLYRLTAAGAAPVL